MRTRRLLCSGLLVFLSGALVSAQQNHFKVYPVRPATTFRPITVTLKDQFAREPSRVRLASLPLFANPVKKTYRDTTSPIGNPNAHLTWYKFEKPEMTGRRVVRFKNQFGEQKWELGEAVFLLVPTQKVEAGSSMPRQFNHFKAYTVRSGQFSPVKVTLQDQFDKQPVPVEVLKPLFFCNPTTKNAEPIADPRYHLACYSTRGGTAPSVRTIPILNQFKENRLFPGGASTILCVPTQKLGWEPIK